jgi:hypothetical protein
MVSRPSARRALRQCAIMHARAGADPTRPSYAFDGGCLAFTDDLHRVMWPRKFRPHITFKYYGSTVHSWEDLCEEFINTFQGGYKRPGTLNDLLALSQRPKETLCSFMQCFC